MSPNFQTMNSQTQFAPSEPNNLQILEMEKAIRRARTNLDAHAEFVIKDQKTGERVKQAFIHRAWSRHIELCMKAGRYCGIEAPWRHGKTSQAVGNFCLRELGKNPRHRIKIVCSADNNAVARVAMLGKYITEDSDFKAVWPNCIPSPDPSDPWAGHRLMLKRDTSSPDASIEAWGVESSGTGGGCSLMIWDDVIDLRNAILIPAKRLTVKTALSDCWLPRLDEDGFLLCIVTAWHNDDAIQSEYLKNSQFCWLIQRISEDFKRIDCELMNKEGVYPANHPDKWSIPLWDRWNEAKLKERFAAIKSRAFNRGYRQQAISDEDRTFAHSPGIFNYDLDVVDIVRPDWPRYAGCDPFGQWVVIFIAARSPDGKRVLVDIIRLRKGAPSATVEELWRAFQVHRFQVLNLENNAAQQAIQEWLLEKHRDIPTKGFMTGAHKADPNVGLPSLDVEFENGSWIIPAKRIKKHEPGCDCALCALRNELFSHPVSATEDCIMAMWFCREAIREGGMDLGIDFV